MESARPKKARLGRPKLPKARVRASILRVPLREEERRQLRRAAEQADVSEAEYARRAIFERLRDEKS